jgi:hypothetical protein
LSDGEVHKSKEKIMPTSGTSNRRDVIQELLMNASIAALNAELINLGISADRIVAVHFVAGQPYASGKGDQFRVLYRAG